MSNLLSRFLKPSAWIAKLLVLLLIVGFYLFGYFGYLEPIKNMLDAESLAFYFGDIRFSLYLIVKSLLIIILLFWLAHILSSFGEKKIRSISRIRSSNRSLLTKATQMLIYFLAFMIGLDLLGVDLTTLTVFSGAVGIGIGFGLQKITSNFMSGLILLFEKSVEDNDLVELSDGIYGFVRQTNARYTLIETFDGKEIMVPNEDFITNRVTNWTFSNSQGRIEINVGVSYDCDLEKANELMLEAAKEHPRCITDPEPKNFLIEFGDSSVNFQLLFWVGDVKEGRLETQSEVMWAIWRKFKENNITIPFPQRDLHIINQEKEL